MKKMRKLNNKGFSLVELIIVIAIMAVLVGVLAPQFTKYVGQSKESADAANADKLRTTAAAVLVDDECEYSADAVQTFDISGPMTDDANSGNLFELMEDAIGAGNWPEPQETGNVFRMVITPAGGGYTVDVSIVAAAGGES